MSTGADARIDLAVIGGTGLYALAELQDLQTQQPVTRYGALSGPVRIRAYSFHHSRGLPPGKSKYQAASSYGSPSTISWKPRRQSRR